MAAHIGQATQARQLDALTRSDREYEIETWCDDTQIDDGWELAPVLVEMGYLSNPGEEKALATAAHQDKIAQAVFDAIAPFRAGTEKMAP